MINKERMDIKNVAIVGGGGAGKTLLVEAILFAEGVIPRLGSCEEGTTTCDFDEEEIKRHMSINLSLAYITKNQKKINFLDTPGYFDFIGEVIRSLAVADICVLVVDATSPIPVELEHIWNYTEKTDIIKIFFINKLDKENADFIFTLKSLRELFGIKVVSLQLPLGKGPNFSSVAYLLSEDKKEGDYKELREQLEETLAETDDKLLELYLQGEEIKKEEWERALITGLQERKVIPVISGAAAKNIGIKELLDLLDSIEVKKKRIEAPLAAYVFKVIADPYVGEYTLVRLYAGELSVGQEVYNPNKGKKERVAHICFMRGKSKEETSSLNCSDIGALVKFRGATTGDVLCLPENPVELPPIEFPKPTISLAVNPKTKQDQEKLSLALKRLHEEDPTFHVYLDHELQQTIISGMGELHLDVTLSKLQNKFGTEVRVEQPNIPYRETIKKSAKGEGKYKRQTGGRGQYGHCFLEISPLPLNQEPSYEFINDIFGGAIPSKYIPAVEKGVKDTLQKGILAGYPIKWVKIRLYDGSFHEVDSSDVAFHLAASFAFKDAFKDAQPELLEPIMLVEVLTPESCMGEVIGNLNSKRGKILNFTKEANFQKISAHIPLAEMYKYATTLRSLTSGRGSFTMTFSHYEEVPPHIKEKIIAQAQAKEK